MASKARSKGSKIPPHPRDLPLAELDSAIGHPHVSTARYLWWLSHIAGSESVTGIDKDAKPWKVLGLLDASRLCPWGVEPLVAIYQQAASTGPKQLVIAFRGTDPLNLMDWVTKSRFELTDWIGGRDAQVHRSFQESLQAKFKTTKKDLTTGKVAVGSTIESVLLNLVRTHDARVWLTGHSLGGALAQLMAASLAESGLARNIEGIYTYGQPRVGNEAFRYIYEEELGLGTRTFRFVNDLDLIPMIPFATSSFGPLNPMGWLLRASHIGEIGFLGELEATAEYRHAGIEVALPRERTSVFSATPSDETLDMLLESRIYARTGTLTLPFFLRIFTDHLRAAYRDKVWSWEG